MSTKKPSRGAEGAAVIASDEPLFQLLAQDPIAPFLVSIWASIRQGDPLRAQATFGRLIAQVAPDYFAAPEIEKAEEALDRAAEMLDWRKARAAA